MTGLLLLSLALSAEPKPDAAALEHFEKKVRPILVEQCQKCHGLDAKKKPKGNLRMLARADLLKGGENGPALVPGDPAKSLIVTAVHYENEAYKMPPEGKLKPAEIAAIEAWVKAGAPWPADTAVSVVEAPKAGPLFTEEQKKFWSFQPVVRPKVGGNAIDALLNSKIAAAGLKPAPPADKRTLLRRATFDLIGLPPPPDELAAFEKDTSPEAFSKVVDRLLASPAYGERWARHWLDVARYADSNGMDENTAFGHAWKYRDYVVRSFNDDKPYARFLKEQIAGDLLPPSPDPKAERDRFAALGYLSIGPKLLAEPDKQKMLIDIADEQLDTVGKSVMGLTLGCARCHDHKFDPLPTRDYYSLLAVFTSTRTMQNLNTVAKVQERNTNAAETAAVKADRAKLPALKKDVAKLEAEFGKTPEKDKEKRGEIHAKAEEKRTEIKKIEASLPAEDIVLAVEEGTPGAYGTQPRNLHVQVRGSYVTAGEEAPAVFPRILAGETQPAFISTTANPNDKAAANATRFGSLRAGSGRLQLAEWLTDPKHPLTARVFVNRVWQHHFGEGLVRSPDNFGKLGDRPTHPELLDWLAAEFLEPTSAPGSPGTLKRLHRIILLSDAYRRSCAADPKAATADPDNKLLSYFPRRRIEAESIRDAILAVSGQLDRTIGGTLAGGPNNEANKNLEYVGDVKYESNRRSLYLPVIRAKLFDFFQTFDFPDPGVTVGKRIATTVAPQALYLMNSPFAREQGHRLANLAIAGGADTPKRIEFAYRRALSRAATPDEVTRVTEFLVRAEKALEPTVKDPGKRTEAAWSAFAQMLFASSEFLFVE